MPLPEDYIRLGWHVVPRDLSTDSIRIGWYNPPRDMLLNHDVRVGNFHLTPELFGGAGKPRITSAGSAGGTVGVPFNYQIVATNNPTSFAATGLPPGLSINTATGEISCTPTTPGTTTSITISATNDVGSGSRTLSIQIAAAGEAPTIISGTSASGTINIAFSHQVVASGNPTIFNATGLPPGLSIDNSGLISGTPTATGTTTAQITATNTYGTSAPHSLLIQIVAAAPTITNVNPNNGPAAGGTSVIITGSHLAEATAVWFGAANAASFTVNSDTQITAMSPSGTGGVSVTVTTPGGTSGGMTFTYAAPLTAPVITSPNTASATEGTAFSYTITASGNPAPTNFNATGLPAWLSRTGAVVSGTPPAGSGNSSVNFTVTATNSEGTSPGVLVTVSIAAPAVGWTITRSHASGVTFDWSNPIPLTSFTGWQPAYLADFGSPPDFIYDPAVLPLMPIRMHAKMTSDAAEYEVHFDGNGPGTPGPNHITQWGYDGAGNVYIVGANSTGQPVALRLVKA